MADETAPVPEKKLNPFRKGNPGAPKGHKGRQPDYIVEERTRQVEIEMIKGRPTHEIVRWGVAKWGLHERSVNKYIETVEVRWREEWKNDPERHGLRAKAIASLTLARNECWTIIRATRTIPRKDPAGRPIPGQFAKVYVYAPTIRLQAIQRLSGVERDLAKIGGYVADVNVDLVNIVNAQAVNKGLSEVPSGEPTSAAPPKGLIAGGDAFGDYFGKIVERENRLIDAEAVVLPEKKQK